MSWSQSIIEPYYSANGRGHHGTQPTKWIVMKSSHLGGNSAWRHNFIQRSWHTLPSEGHNSFQQHVVIMLFWAIIVMFIHAALFSFTFSLHVPLECRNLHCAVLAIYHETFCEFLLAKPLSLSLSNFIEIFHVYHILEMFRVLETMVMNIVQHSLQYKTALLSSSAMCKAQDTQLNHQFISYHLNWERMHHQKHIIYIP